MATGRPNWQRPQSALPASQAYQRKMDALHSSGLLPRTNYTGATGSGTRPGLGPRPATAGGTQTIRQQKVSAAPLPSQRSVLNTSRDEFGGLGMSKDSLRSKPSVHRPSTAGPLRTLNTNTTQPSVSQTRSSLRPQTAGPMRNMNPINTRRTLDSTNEYIDVSLTNSSFMKALQEKNMRGGVDVDTLHTANTLSSNISAIENTQTTDSRVSRLGKPKQGSVLKEHSIEEAKSRHDEMMMRLRSLSNSWTLEGGSLRNKGRVVAEIEEICQYFSAENAHQSMQVNALKKKIDWAEKERLEMKERLKSSEEAHKQFQKFSYTSSDLRSLQRSILMIEQEIGELDSDGVLGVESRFATDTGGDPIMPETQEGKIQYLTEMKFKAMEDLIFVLKKKLLKYEENSDLTKCVKEYQGVGAIMEELRRLQKENHQLRIREQRYATDALLKRRKIYECDPVYLRTMVIALQNELSCAQEVIQRMDFEASPDLRFEAGSGATAMNEGSSSPYEKMKHLDEVFMQTYVGMDVADDEEGRGPPGELPDHDDAYLKYQLSTLEQQNCLLKYQVERLQNELDVQSKSVDILAKENAQALAHEPNKKIARVMELQAQNYQLLQHNKEVVSKLNQREDTIVLQKSMTDTLTQQKKEALDRSVSMSQKLLKQIKKAKDQRGLIRAMRTKCESMYHLTALLALSHIKNSGMEESDWGLALEMMYEHAMVAYFQSSKAAMTIQRWFRRQMTRRRRRFSGQHFKDPKLYNTPMHQQKTIKELLSKDYRTPRFTFLCEINSVSKDTVHRLGSFLPMLRQTKYDLIKEMKPDIKRVLQEANDNLKNDLTLLGESLAILNPPRLERSTQTRARTSQGSTQTEAAFIVDNLGYDDLMGAWDRRYHSGIRDMVGPDEVITKLPEPPAGKK